ncbi:MAG TPA: peptidylprolyl isomerase [Thermoleophilaceae bacterium]|nr:peptidylprolyl isomerase [Thermoleophilaceae bacterium]
MLCLALLLAACGSSKKDSSGESSSSSNASSSNSSATGGSPGANGAAKADCTKVSPPSQKGEKKQSKPSGKLDTSKKWSLDVQTNCGSFTIELDTDAAPNTSASLVELARAGFFDGLTFHRIVPGFVIQGGDPTGTGGGGPGYKTVDKPPASARYTRGVVAMAKTESEKPGTAGSQFFVVTGDDAGLPPDYAVVGRVVAGLEVVDQIGKLGDPATEQPTQPVVMSKVTVKEG